MEFELRDFGGVHRVYLTEMPPHNPEIGTQWLDTRANVVMEWNGMYWFVTEDENDDA